MIGREAPVVAIYGNVPLPRAVRLVEAFRAKYPTGKRGFRCRIVYGDEVTVYRTEKGTIVVRGGYGYRTEDRDDLTEHNESLVHAGSLGFGYRQPASKWSIDAGFTYEWITPDFVDATNARSNRQLLSTRLRWVF